MLSSTGRTQQQQKNIKKAKSYNELIDYLDALPRMEYSEQAVSRMRQLDQLCGLPSSKLDIVSVCGTNGKSSTMHFAAKLLKEEGFAVGICYSTHFLTYNERIINDDQQIQNKIFTDLLNEVIDISETNTIHATSFELMTIAALLHFQRTNIGVALVEAAYGGKHDATAAFKPQIVALTRVADDTLKLIGSDLDAVALEMVGLVKQGTWCVSADQSKLRLQKIKQIVESQGGQWAMPIRKLATLPYMFEQLYGRAASLGERIAQIYVEDLKGRFSPFLRGNLLATKQGQRGRPTLEAKRQAELNPMKTLKTFWHEHFNLPKGRFELLNTEKPSILLDNASNIDALVNLFLGIRLLHYQHPLKGFALVLGLHKSTDSVDAIKLIRYLLKKVSGSVFFIGLSGENIPSHDPESLVAIARDLNVKAYACASLEDACAKARESVDVRDGLVCVTGSSDLIAHYWRKNPGMKKFV